MTCEGAIRGEMVRGRVGYPIGYCIRMVERSILEQARSEAGMSQSTLAARAGTSRPTLSAYENGKKSPSLETVRRILAAAGFALTITPIIEFHEVSGSRGRPIAVPTRLPRLPVERALATVELPIHLNWSDRGRRYDLRQRRPRARVYELVLREGEPSDVLAYIDGALLVDLWEDLVLPAAVRDAWWPVVTAGAAEQAA